MSLRDRPDDGESQARAWLARGEKWLKDFVAQMRGNAGPVVGNHNFCPAGSAMASKQSEFRA
jgi:hypothetical protein